jgi:hypothetical protein
LAGKTACTSEPVKCTVPRYPVASRVRQDRLE